MVSQTTCYTVLVYSLWSVMNVRTLGEQVHALLHAADMNAQLLNLILLAYLTCHWLVPFFIWPQAAELVRFFNAWTSLQVSTRPRGPRGLDIPNGRTRAVRNVCFVSFPLVAACGLERVRRCVRAGSCPPIRGLWRVESCRPRMRIGSSPDTGCGQVNCPVHFNVVASRGDLGWRGGFVSVLSYQ